MTRYDPISVIPFFVIFIVIIGVVYANVSRQRFLNQTIAQSSPQPVNTPESYPTDYPKPTESPLASAAPNPTLFPLTSANPSSGTTSNSDLNTFKYPGAAVKSSSPTEMELTSTDNPNTITEWYKTKIRNLGLTTNTMSTTNTNNNILNALAAVGNGQTVKVEIRKDSSASNTTIKVSK